MTKGLAKSLPLPKAFDLALAQAEVDFVIPDLATDIPVCIDPFLLFKSRDPILRRFHDQLVGLFGHGFELHADGDRPALDRLIDFPEVNAIGFGYSRAAIRGRGLGWHLNQLLVELLEASADIRERGLRHVEELQLLSVGVGPDRISDIAANVLKLPLVEYTQQQSELWGIPLQRSVPVSHYFNPDEMDWGDGYFDLPVNPVSNNPILLVPRRIVRLLPWINYEDFYASEAALLLPPRPRRPRYPGMKVEARAAVAKAELIDRLLGNTSVLDRYVGRKESSAEQALPILSEPDLSQLQVTGQALLEMLGRIEPGPADAATFQRVVYEILNFAFEPELTGGELEVATYLGTERRDIIYWNEAERSFWAYVRSEYKSPLVMFECKNVATLEIEHINQVAAYLGARLGMLGLIVTRAAPPDNVMRKAYTVYNDSVAIPRKVILILSDAELVNIVEGRMSGQSAAGIVQGVYRKFRQSVQ